MSFRGANGVSDEAISDTTRRLLHRLRFVCRPLLVFDAPLSATIPFFLLSSFVLFSCSTSTPPATPQVVTVYSTSAAQPWLNDIYQCAGQNNVVLSRIDDSFSASITLRVGEPKILSSPAYQIDTDEILIVTHRQSLVQNLTVEEARTLFAGQGDP